jgi:hypothetical protein
MIWSERQPLPQANTLKTGYPVERETLHGRIVHGIPMQSENRIAVSPSFGFPNNTSDDAGKLFYLSIT